VTCTFPVINVLLLELFLLFNGKAGVSASLIVSRHLSWFEEFLLSRLASDVYSTSRIMNEVLDFSVSHRKIPKRHLK